MTLPDERYRSVLMAKKLLEDLSFSGTTKRIPLEIRQRARGILRHYPSDWDMVQACAASPHIFQEQMEAVTRLFAQYEQNRQNPNKSE